MATPKQVQMLEGLMKRKGLWGQTLRGQRLPIKVYDWLFENGLDVEDLEQLTQDEVTKVKGRLEEREDGF